MNVIQQSGYDKVMQKRSFLTLLGRNAMYALSIASNHSKSNNIFVIVFLYLS